MQFWLAQICIDLVQLHAVALRSPALLNAGCGHLHSCLNCHYILHSLALFNVSWVVTPGWAVLTHHVMTTVRVLSLA